MERVKTSYNIMEKKDQSAGAGMWPQEGKGPDEKTYEPYCGGPGCRVLRGEREKGHKGLRKEVIMKIKLWKSAQKKKGM